MTYHIICLSTFEEVLASICYMPYWTYTALVEAGHQVTIHEDVTYRSYSELDDAGTFHSGDVTLFDVSSAPQIALAGALASRYGRHYQVAGVGYPHFIRQAGLRVFDVSDVGADLATGVFRYPYHSHSWKYGYATIDSHIVCPDPRPFYPIFTSVGCKRKCDYCYVPYSNYPYDILPYEECIKLLDWAVEQNYNLHFEDENFFRRPDAEDIIRACGERGLRWIILTDSIRLSRQLRHHGEKFFVDNGLWLAEIGLETVEPSVLSKRQDITDLLDCDLSLFWLSMTFLPGETIGSLNKAGQFYWNYGMKWEQLLPRLRTQSSWGGLGQFFQGYPGTPLGDNLPKLGKQLAAVPIRLRPSFVGYPFLVERPVVARPLHEGHRRWVELYGSWDVASGLWDTVNGILTMEELSGLDREKLALLAILCRLEVLQ